MDRKTVSEPSEEYAKRKYDSEGSKRRLIRAGIDVFSKEGFDGATTKKIAKSAQVNESLIHRYFESKLGLFFAILGEFHRCVVAEPPYPPSDNLEDELRNFVRFRMEFSRNRKKFIRLGITRAIIDKKTREEMTAYIQNGTLGLVSRLERLRAAGKVRSDVSLEQVALMIVGVTFSMSMFSVIIFAMEQSLIENVLSLATKILAEGLAPPDTRKAQ
jgi:TetR/AcrR family transcriptional regulator, regulator of cefoperazone and chloramphenicol sensitivity